MGIVLAMGPMSGYGDRTEVSCEARTYGKKYTELCSDHNGKQSKCEAAKQLVKTYNGCAGSDDTIHVYYPCMCNNHTCEFCVESETEKCSNTEEKVKSCAAGKRGSKRTLAV